VIALLEASRAGLLGREHWARNIVAGLVVGVVALPLAMAFAIASGARPEQGIYTAIVAGALVSILGGSRLQIAGPTGAFVVILSGVTAEYGIGGLQVATLLAGVMLVLMGVTKLGGVIRFIPAPVIVGFTTGIGVIIFVGQWRGFLGLPEVGGAHFHDKVWHLLQAMPQTHLATVGLAVLGLLVTLFAPRLLVALRLGMLARVPGPLLAMLAVTLLQSLLLFPGVATIGSEYGAIPSGLPTPQWPDLTLSQALQLIGPAFTIAMLGAIESLLSAVVADGMAGTRHDSNQELVGQGIANIVAPLFGGFAATGAIARTATNVRNGATSPLAGIAHSVTLVLVLLFLAPLASSIPLAVLSAILFVVAWNMSEAKHFVHMALHAPVADKVILLTTFVLTVFVDLVVAVNVGVILAMLHFIRRMSESVEAQPADEKALAATLGELGVPTLPPGVLVFEVDGPVFFGAVDKLERALLATHVAPQLLVLRLARVPFVDMTGIETLRDVIAALAARNVQVRLCEANARVHAKLEAAGVIGAAHADLYRPTLRDALADVPGIAQAGSPASAGAGGP
jgi:SulP family sulfate permease